MRRSNLAVLGLALVATLTSVGLSAHPAWAQEAPRLDRQPLAPSFQLTGATTPNVDPFYRQRARYERLHWRIEFPLWVPGVSNGSFAVNGEKIESDEPGDILNWLFPSISDIRFYFVGLVEARKGPWGITLDTFGGTIGSSSTFRLTDGTVVDGEVTAITPRGVITRRITKRRWGGTEVEALAYAGARAYIIDLSTELFTRRTIFDESAWWVDPIVGLRLEAAFGRRWHATLAGDVGGFGAGSNFAWWLGASVRYSFSRVVGIGLGWTILDVDFTGTRANGNRIDFDVRLSGPTLYLTFDF